MKISKSLKLFLIIVFICAVIFASIATTRWILTLKDPVVMEKFKQFVSSLGFGGWLLLLGIQYFQIVIAFIPGGPIQIIAGALFGPVGGMATCLLGTIAGALTIFYLVSRHGKKIISKFVPEKEQHKYKFLTEQSSVEKLVLALFFIPGTPKDGLTYLFALTPIPLSRFLFLSTIARIPAMLTSVMIGQSISNGNWMRALIYFVTITTISAVGLLLHKKIMQKHTN